MQCQILGIVVTEYAFVGATIADAGDHRGMVQRVRYDNHVGDR